MKIYYCIIITLAFITVGCSPSNKASTSNPQTLTQTAAEPDTDEDFDLLEDQVAEQMIDVPDPLEGLNRLTFHVNDTVYFWFLKPVSETYEKTIPHPIRLGIRNFFQNLTTPVRFVNCHLQGKTEAADIELKRFAINTTSGILGFGDPAKDRCGLEPVPEDLGQSLAALGLKDGFFLILPLLGPSTARDAAGTVGDLFLNPVFYIDPRETAVGISAGKFVNESSFQTGEYETFKEAAVDPYIAMRQTYIQYRTKQIEQ